jgi:hypothetical protein
LPLIGSSTGISNNQKQQQIQMLINLLVPISVHQHSAADQSKALVLMGGNTAANDGLK